VCLKITAEGVAGLLEECVTVPRVGFGPQGGDEFVAAQPAVTRGSKEGEQCQRLSLLGRAGGRDAVDFYGGSAERLEVEHVAPFDRSLTGLSPSAFNVAPVP